MFFPHRATRRTVLAAAAASAALTLTACSTGPTGETASGGGGGTEAQGSADAFPVTVKHTFGETTIKSEPQRVVTVGWSDADFVVDLGVVPVGVPAITWGGNENQSNDWFDQRLQQIDGEEPTRYDDTDGVPVDEIAELSPDLILGTNSGLTKAEYTKLSKLAPVVAYPGDAWGTSWEDSLAMVGKALGRSPEAEKLADETNQAIEQARSDHPDLQGKTAAWGWFTPTDLSTVGLYVGQDNRPQMLEEFGMKPAPVVQELGKDGAFSANLSAEKADTLEADLFIFYAESDSDDEKIKADPLLGRIPALERGSYLASTDNQAAQPMSSPTTLSIPHAIEEFLPQLDQPASQAG